MLAFCLGFLEVHDITVVTVCVKRTSHQVHCDHSSILVTSHMDKTIMTTVEKRISGAVVISGRDDL